MISRKEVLAIQEILIDRFGGLKGVRDLNALESALNRPLQTFEAQFIFTIFPSGSDGQSGFSAAVLASQPLVVFFITLIINNYEL